MFKGKIVLKPGKERPLLRFHPWVFSGAIARTVGNPAEGDLAEVLDSSGGRLGCGHFAKGSIAVRIISFGESIPTEDFWLNSFRLCFTKRRLLGLPDEQTTLYRLVHGEGDGLPGLIVDVYGSTAVVQCHSAGMFKNRDLIARAIVEASNGGISSVFDKSSDTLGSASANGFLVGELSRDEIFLENGLKFRIDFQKGQKTGFFVDQRDNRKLLREYSRDKTVLNTFCYTGGFSVYALAGGARHVDSVDSSRPALELAEENAKLNDFTERHSIIQADVPEWLKSNKQKYDLIVLDPPAFAKHHDARHRAVQAYKRLNMAAIRSINANGILFTFSCSQVVDRELFRNTITAAAIESGRKVSILHQLSQPADHPVSIYHPEGEYLKGLVVFVE